MPTDECRLPLTPVLPWQRPPVTRNRKGQFMPGVCGNPRGRPTKRMLEARLAARASTHDYVRQMQRRAAYDGLTPHELTRLLRATYGKLGWQAQAARDMLMSKRGIFRWAKGVHKISHENETLLLKLCLRLARANYRYVLALYRRAVAAANAREELASMPRHRPMTRPGTAADGFLTARLGGLCFSDFSKLAAILEAILARFSTNAASRTHR